MGEQKEPLGVLLPARPPLRHHRLLLLVLLVRPSQSHSGPEQLNFPSAPSSPSHAVKRARALSQPAIPCFDDLHSAGRRRTARPSMTGPIMRTYSPSAGAPAAHRIPPFPDAVLVVLGVLLLPVLLFPLLLRPPPRRLSLRRKRCPRPAGATVWAQRRSRAHPKSSKNIFHASPPSSSSSASSALVTPKSSARARRPLRWIRPRRASRRPCRRGRRRTSSPLRPSRRGGRGT